MVPVVLEDASSDATLAGHAGRETIARNRSDDGERTAPEQQPAVVAPRRQRQQGASLPEAVPTGQQVSRFTYTLLTSRSKWPLG